LIGIGIIYKAYCDETAMNLREANVMREQMADLRSKLALLEKRIALVEDALSTLPVTVGEVFHVEQTKRGPGRPRKNANDR
jgi:hypothetical protein